MKARLLALATEVGAGSLVLSITNKVYAADCTPGSEPLGNGISCAQPSGKAGSAHLFGAGSVFQKVANILIFLVGAIAVIMLIVGGLRYVLSGGSKDAVEGAKNTILYAIIGIVVAILAYAAVQFVVNNVG